MVLIDDVLRIYFFLPRLDGDWYPVFIRTTDEQDIFTFQPQVTDINIRRNVYPGQVTDMDRAVGVRQSRGD